MQASGMMESTARERIWEFWGWIFNYKVSGITKNFGNNQRAVLD